MVVICSDYYADCTEALQTPSTTKAPMMSRGFAVTCVRSRQLPTVRSWRHSPVGVPLKLVVPNFEQTLDLCLREHPLEVNRKRQTPPCYSKLGGVKPLANNIGAQHSHGFL